MRRHSHKPAQTPEIAVEFPESPVEEESPQPQTQPRRKDQNAESSREELPSSTAPIDTDSLRNAADELSNAAAAIVDAAAKLGAGPELFILRDV
jgi:hypothetical protein